MSITAGDELLVRTATGTKVPRRAVSGIVAGEAFAIVWVCREEEYESAHAEGREPDAVPWPANAVEPK
jgi:hypothetical protein